MRHKMTGSVIVPASGATRADNYVSALTGIRAIAAGTVVFFHYFLSVKALRAADLPDVSWFFGAGQFGVSIFFALSGFLITLRYRDGFAANRVRFRDYWLKRLIRIYPVYAFVLTFGAILPALLDGSRDYANPLTWLALYGMGQAFLFSLFTLGIPIGWSLTVEELFYLIAPRVGGWIDTARRGIRGIVVTGLILSAISVALFAFTMLIPVGPLGERLGPYLSGFNTEFMFNISFLVRLPEFVSGMVCAILLLRYRERIGSRARMFVLVGAAAAVGFMLASNQAFEVRDFPLYAFFRYLSATGSAILMLGLSFGPPSTSIARFLSSPLMDYLGKTSYSLYLVHVSIPMQRVWGALVDLPINPLVSVPLMYLISVAASIGLYELVEHPIHARLSKKIR